MSIKTLRMSMMGKGQRAQVALNLDALAAMVAAQAHPGDHILCMSNGGFGGVHDKIAKLLRGR